MYKRIKLCLRLHVVGETHISVVRETRWLLHKNHFLSEAFLSTHILIISFLAVLLEWGMYPKFAYKHRKYKTLVTIKHKVREDFSYTQLTLIQKCLHATFSTNDNGSCPKMTILFVASLNWLSLNFAFFSFPSASMSGCWSFCPADQARWFLHFSRWLFRFEIPKLVKHENVLWL